MVCHNILSLLAIKSEYVLVVKIFKNDVVSILQKQIREKEKQQLF